MFFGYETWYFALREERRQDVFEIRELRKIFGFNPLARILIPGGFSGKSRYKLEDLIFMKTPRE
jgi:hypothetical protein